MFEQYVSEETILKEIMYYIDTDFYNYAVMIDGAWGECVIMMSGRKSARKSRGSAA